MTPKLSSGRKVLSSALVIGLGMLGVAAVANEPAETKRPTAHSAQLLDLIGGDEVGRPAQQNYAPKGRYQTLLRKIEVPSDQRNYGDFYDYGYYSGAVLFFQGPLSGTDAPEDAPASFHGDTERFVGESLLPAIDVTGDGPRDVVMGSPGVESAVFIVPGLAP